MPVFRRLLLASLVLAAALAAGCAAPRPLTLSEARSRCIAYSPGGQEDGFACIDHVGICASILAAMEPEPPAGREACFERCRQAERANSHYQRPDHCGELVGEAESICELYCRNQTPGPGR